MFRLIAIAATATALSGCVVAPGYGYYDSGYSGYGGAYAPAYEYGSVGIWGGGGGGYYRGGPWHHGRGRDGWGDGDHGGGYWHAGGGGHGAGGAHGGGAGR